MSGLLRHVYAVQNFRLPGGRLPFLIGQEQVGWVSEAAASALEGQRFDCRMTQAGMVLPHAEDLPDMARALAEAGHFPWRGEAFDVRAAFDGRVLTTLDRGALPWFGVQAEGVHVNGVVRRADGLHLWIARRAAGRPMDPGKLDHLFAGGIAAGMDAESTLFKEGGEEAGLAPEVVDRAVYAGSIGYTMLRPEGLRRDRLHCYDLELPEGVEPVAFDGEVERFELWPAARVAQALRETDAFKFNVALVIIDFLLRWRQLPEDAETAALTQIFRGPPPDIPVAAGGS